MRAKVTLITGAAGEVGQALIQRRMTEFTCESPGAAAFQRQILALDLNPSPALPKNVHQVQGSILDTGLLDRLVSEYEIEEIYHLLALLSTRAEFSPDAAHKVNVEGTLGLLHLAAQQSEWRGAPVRFIFPSSIAVFGLPDLKTKTT